MVSDSAVPPNTSTCNLNVEVTDTPTMTCPSDLTLTDGQALSLEELTPATATSGCGNVLPVSVRIESETLGQCPTTKQVVVRWEAAGVDGSTAACLQQITFVAADTDGDGRPNCGVPKDITPIPLPGCGGAGCGANSMLSLAVMMLGFVALKYGRGRSASW